MKKCATLGDWSCPRVFCKECVINEVNMDCVIETSKRDTKCYCCDVQSVKGSGRVLECVLSRLFSKLESLEDKYMIVRRVKKYRLNPQFSSFVNNILVFL
jgi:hypothetical protein